MRIRTAIFVVYVVASAVGFAALLGIALRDVRLRYVESMRRTLGDTAAFLAAIAAEGSPADGGWTRPLAVLPPKADLLRVFALDREDRVLFDSAHGRDVGQVYAWPMRGGGPVASEDYSLPNVAVVGDELRVRASVRIGGERVGWVGVGRALSTVTEGVAAARWRIVRYALAVAAVMVLAGWWIATRLTHSLERLTAYALAVRDGRRAAPPVSRAREIAALSRAFEEMRVTLEGKAHVERYTQALAHEFKAPLSSIRGAAELLAEDPPEPDRARFLANLRAESERLQQIVERLLELAALEARREGVAAAPVALAELVGETVRAAEPAAAVKNIVLTCHRHDAPTVPGDRFLLGHAISNLLQNALAFTPAGGTVQVGVAAAAGRAVVTIDDSGPGVPDYALGQVFERFYSLPRPDTGRKSSGLGLSIVREVARLHGGEATLENRPGGGARAVLTVPHA